MGIDETWAISADRIALFFAQQSDVVRTPEGFAFRDCRIRLTPVSRKVLGQWTLPATHVELSAAGRMWTPFTGGFSSGFCPPEGNSGSSETAAA